MTSAAMPAIPKPLPHPTPVSRPFWDAAREHRLSLQRCAACGRHVYYPRTLCPHCGDSDLAWTDVSGRGTVYSYTIARRATARPFEPDVPYVIAIVELEEGPHMTTNIVGCDPDAVHIGMPVEAAFDDVTDEVTLVTFRPAQ
jgi:uncharacterized OB-fold protein